MQILEKIFHLHTQPICKHLKVKWHPGWGRGENRPLVTPGEGHGDGAPKGQAELRVATCVLFPTSCLRTAPRPRQVPPVREDSWCHGRALGRARGQ